MATTRQTKKSSDSIDDIDGLRRFKLGDTDRQIIPTGIIDLDVALGGGLPRGVIVEAFGPEAGGKSAIALAFAASAQKYGEVIYIDLEDTLTDRLMTLSGIDIERLLMFPDETVALEDATAEKIFDRLIKFSSRKDTSAVIIDSVAALVPAAELAGDMSDGHMMILPRILSDGLKRINLNCKQNGEAPTFFFVNQIRAKHNPTGRGAMTQSTGGKALKFYSSVRLDVRPIGREKKGEEVIGHNVQVNVDKNKFSPQGKKANFKVIYEHGISNESTILDLAVAQGKLTRAGSWYKFPGEEKNTANGEPAMCQWLRDNPMEAELLKDAVLADL